MTVPNAVPMTPDRWREVDAILQAALDCDRDRRDAFVREACGDDAALRREVESLLAAHDAAADDFLEAPPDPAPVTPAGHAERLAAALAGRYEIERELARGGMATVYVARDLRHGRRVAIKVVREEVAAAVGAARFLEEIRVTASLQHPHVLPLFDSGSTGDLLWYAMPFADGETLRARLDREGRLPVGEAVRIAREVADALAHAHARGVVHRDIKPENILLTPDASTVGHALVADFGIALAAERAGGERLTRTGLALGTPQYMAPEQAAGARALDARVDVYALGAVLHEMLAGEPPFAAPSRQAVVRRMLHEAPTALASYRSDVPPSIDAAVQRALAKTPEGRFPTAAAFAAALTAPAAPAEPASAPSSGTYAPEPRPGGRAVSVRGAFYAALVALVVGLMGGWALARSPLAARWLPASPPTIRAGAPARSTTLYGRGAGLVVVGRDGAPLRELPASRPWTPRFSPDGQRLAYGAFGDGRGTSDIWVTDLEAGTTRRLTDDDADSNDPQWSPDGSTVAYSVAARGGKDIAARPATGGPARPLAMRGGTQFASDWTRDGSALLVIDDAGGAAHDVLVQPADGSAAFRYAASSADETAARVSPDGRWVAYMSNASGREEVYLDRYPRPGHRVRLTEGGGVHPVWRGDGRELYFWRGDELVAVRLDLSRDMPSVGDQTTLFRAPYHGGLNTMYDVSPDGQRFVIVRRR